MASTYRHGESKQARRGRAFWHTLLVITITALAFCIGWYQGGQDEAVRQKEHRARVTQEAQESILRITEECKDGDL